MKSNFPIKRLYRIALYTSTAIGLITMGPVYVIAFSFSLVKIEQPLLLKLIGLAVLGISALVFVFWTINIALSYIFSKRSFSSLVKKNITRYLWSYILCYVMFISTKLIFNYVILSPTLNNAIINWKIKEFGIHSDYIGQLQNKEGLFPYLILTFMVVSINTIVIIIQGLVLLLEKKTLIESENTQLRIKNIEAANQKLKQQLQPHFLFNSLNILKTLIKKQPDDAEAYLKRLSDFLRASVSFDNANTVKFEEELKLCMDYLEMQKIRFGDAILFEINFPDEVKTGFVPIFSIQLLLENAIKHNAFTIESPLCIRLIYQERWITVSNNIQHKITTESSAGMGLSNLSERYKIISGDEINIQSSDTYFSVSIKVLPDENSNH